MECWSGFKEMAMSLIMVRLGYGSWSRCFSSTGDLVKGEKGRRGGGGVSGYVCVCQSGQAWLGCLCSGKPSIMIKMYCLDRYPIKLTFEFLYSSSDMCYYANTLYIYIERESVWEGTECECVGGNRV
jgi:hypothetical protein